MTSSAARFHHLHADGIFVMPNAFDVGSARLLEHLGFEAIATTSSGHAASLGRLDGNVSFDELLRHVEAIAAAVDIPVSVDAEHGFSDSIDGIARIVELLASAGAVGFSIEDFNPASQTTDPLLIAIDRVQAAVAAARDHGLVVTARADGLLHGETSTEGVLERLEAFAAHGPECLYAPGLREPEDIAAASRLGAVNVLGLPGVPSVPELAELGVRRVSVGGAFAFVGYGAFAAAAEQLSQTGRFDYFGSMLPSELRSAAFD